MAPNSDHDLPGHPTDERAPSDAHARRTQLLISLTIALALAAYIQARPNTASLVSDGEFDANRVFADLKRLVSFGPRPPGSRALEEGREFIAAELRAAAPASS